MSWDTPNSDLIDFVRQQQSTAIDTYKINPTLLLEHVAQEASFRDGGYGTRQVSELLQNAADALTESAAATPAWAVPTSIDSGGCLGDVARPESVT